MKNYSSMQLNALELQVNLGWPQGERKKTQIVILNVIIYFPTPPLGCITDQLSDSYCYDNLINTIKNSLVNRDFHLLEHLGYEIHQIITKNLPTDLKIHINVTKKPAILNLSGGVTFSYGTVG